MMSTPSKRSYDRRSAWRSHQDLSLPDGYGVVELSTARFCPVSVDISPQFSHLMPLLWEWQTIPFALGPRRLIGAISFASRHEAIHYCQRKDEEWKILYDCDKLAASSEVYPERNAWYREQVAHLISLVSPPWHTPMPRLEQWSDIVIASVWLSIDERIRIVQARASGSDEAYAALSILVNEQLGPAPDEEHFPERNARYQEEIESVTGNVVTVFTERGQAAADVRLSDGTVVQVREASREVALERLCEQVYARLGIDWWQQRAVLSTRER